MADPKVSIPINMRPRGSANAELNAQNREQVLRDMGKLPAAPEVKDVSLRGYQSGGSVRGELPPRAPRGELPPRDLDRMKEAPPKPIINPSQAMPPFTARQLPEKEYNQGGMVTKHGSSTHVSCKSKHGG